MLLSRLSLAHASVHLSKAEMAVGHERSHAERVGDGERLAIVRRRGRLEPAVMVGDRDVAAQTERAGLQWPLAPLAARVQGVTCAGQRRLVPFEECERFAFWVAEDRRHD